MDGNEQRRGWEELRQIPLEQLRTQPYAKELPLRSLRWRVYLGILPGEVLGQSDTACARAWETAAAHERQRYTALRRQHIVDPGTDDRGMHPLSQDEDSPWAQYQRDHGLRHSIAQDVARTFPAESYFRQAHVQQQLADILLVQAKANDTLQYRQGMHELLAVLLIAVDGDAGTAEAAGELGGVLDRRFVEHDAFALFERVMQICGPWYQAPLMAQCARLMGLVAEVDPALHEHLRRVGVEPQLFALRWYRLLFSREVPRVRDVLALWDVLLADGIEQLMDWVGVALLVGNRRRLLQHDHDACLATLLHLPPLPRPTSEVLARTVIPLPPEPDAVPFAALRNPALLPVQRLALQAAYLRAIPTQEAAALVAAQREAWEDDAWEVVGADSGSNSSSSASSDAALSPPPPPPPPALRSESRMAMAPQRRKAYTSSTLQQRRANGTLPRSAPASPPQMTEKARREVRSPGDAALALGAATAQVAGVAAQCLDMLRAESSCAQPMGVLADALRVVARVWQEEALRPSDTHRGALQAADEAELRAVLRSLDRLHMSLDGP
ncbi:hypothetical protein H4R20_001017 [Coemansia guatemalensis]|uniref:Rab-GAP TBC domain-containing protein n=1 Tax=Coemansia guatemalensis TaxID=2761395 RepID=A0A9W8HY32_9FUNG|nr:hypothetical protein H4R20_001017 [Coemansia guatemalensis]